MNDMLEKIEQIEKNYIENEELICFSVVIASHRRQGMSMVVR